MHIKLIIFKQFKGDMGLQIELRNEHLSDDSEHVAFEFAIGKRLMMGSISRSALIMLAGPTGDDLIKIFSSHRDRIAQVASQKWWINPLSHKVLLDINDF